MSTERKVWMSPKYSSTNKYNELFSYHIEKQGIIVKDFKKTNIFSLRKGDILHIHWLHPYYQSRNLILFIIKSIIFLFALFFIKIKGANLVWTVHNLYPHNFKFKKLEYLIRKLTLKNCNLITVASNSIKNLVINEFGIEDSKIKIIEHGHYKGAYTKSNINFRKRYNISNDSFVFLFVGAIKPYKGIEDLLHAFSKLESYDKVHLIIAGKQYIGMDRVLDKIKKNSRITLDLRFIPDNELVDLIETSNVVVLPYKNITTSGTAILACSLNKPIVCPETPFMLEYFNNEIAFMYNNQDEQGLLIGLVKAIEEMENQNNMDSYKRFVKNLDWDKIGQKMFDLYNEL
ncbi:glycosyltransferase family 4 protein [Bacillus sp. ISL-46]|uniref:glycosyltransferase family 4 protein n=1 Tax=Bacillus sp. ISL-46 TaxID=2819129 RepID=UPI001BECFC87|nr:glycosyltransferase family 4 protein [Bacillus sp. ISL-46]MBT2724008.1 glycosyltransferase family 4 protein [Bacillus sp. ISL-46]